jgi:hypothetical protein
MDILKFFNKVFQFSGLVFGWAFHIVYRVKLD